MKTSDILLLAALGVGGYLLYQWYKNQQTLVPAAVNTGLANPQAARNAAFTATNYPGVLPMPTVPAFDPTNPLGLSGVRY